MKGAKIEITAYAKIVSIPNLALHGAEENNFRKFDISGGAAGGD